MENILLESKTDQSALKTFKILSIIYLLSIVFIPLGIPCLVMYTGLKRQKLTITENSIKGAYGTFATRNIDLPIDSINSVSHIKNNGSLTIATSSEKIVFSQLSNSEEIVNLINELIRSRQANRGTATVVNSSSNADELAKFKKLLDDGIITQEEFDTKKKQLLGF